MASRASALLASLLGRVSALFGRPAGDASGPAADPRWTERWPPEARPPGGPRPAQSAGSPSARPIADDEDVTAHVAPQDPEPHAVDVTVVGDAPPGEDVVDGEVDPAADDDTVEGEVTGEEPEPVARPAAATSSRRLRDSVVPAAVVAVLVLVAGLGIRYQGPIGDWLTEQNVRAAAGQLARAWSADRLDRVSFDPSSAVRPGTAQDDEALSVAVAQAVATTTSGLTAAARDVPDDVELVGGVTLGLRREGVPRTATQGARVHWRLDDGKTWSYDTTIQLRQRGSRWRAVFTPALVHPALTPGTGLLAERVQPARAPLLGTGDEPLVRTRLVHTVTFRSNRLITPYGDLGRLARLVDVNRDRLVDRVRDARRGEVVEVARLRDPAWRRVRSEILDIDGTAVSSARVPVAPTPTYAHALIGDVVPASRAMADASDGALRPGDLTGVTGLQRTYDERLRGTAGLRVVAAPLPRTGGLAPRGLREGADPTGPLLVTVAPPAPGTPVRLTLDDDVQRAAQAAVDRVGRRTSLVAVDVRTGAVRAVAGNVDEEWDRPLLGSFPPGSTFKMVTTWALTADGATPSERLRCPATLVVGGNPFRNADGRSGGTASLARQFARSCNTAFAGLGGRVPDAALAAAARDLGIAVPVASLGTGSYAGDVPPSPTPAVHAATLIGQGRVTVSPLSVAVASATVAAGRYTSPTLVLDGPREDTVTGPPLDAVRLGTLRSMLCETVRSGTARALRRAPGGPVWGKTGTAQYGEPEPVGAHGWFTGYQGDLAFAVVVERGGAGAGSAVPVALSFLRGVNGRAPARPARSCGAATAALRG